MRRIINVILGLQLFIASSAMAQDLIRPTSYTSVRVGGGTVLTSGSMMEKAQTYGFTIDLFNNILVADALGGISTSMLFDLWNISGKNEHTAFPFALNDEVNGSLFSLVPQICIFTTSPVSLCAGPGITQITLTDDSGNIQTYGSLSWTYEVGRFHQPGLIFGVRGRYDQIDQKVAKKSSFAGFATHMVQLGWAWSAN